MLNQITQFGGFMPRNCDVAFETNSEMDAVSGSALRSAGCATAMTIGLCLMLLVEMVLTSCF